MRVLVAGGSGFLGSHVADALQQAGHEVTIYDLKPPSYPSEGQAFIQGNILHAESVRKAMEGKEVVYNFAGLADLDRSQEAPVETARMNVLGNAILLEEARREKVERYVFASTVYVAGQAGGFYRASKQACEGYIEEYQRWFSLDYTILRYGTLYGPRADERNSVHRYLRQALLERRIQAEGTGEELREYVHVLDVARLSVQILQPEFRNEIIILTGHHPLRFKDFLEMVREIVGRDVRIDWRPVDPSKNQDGRSTHYTMTPYALRTRTAKKLVSSYYMDLGQGLLSCLEEMQETLPSSPS